MKRAQLHPHDVGLPAPVVRKRQKARRVASWMLSIAVVTAIIGWLIFGTSVWSAFRVQPETPWLSSPWLAILAWGILIVSSATLVLGLWYLLLAQVHRIARMVEADGTQAAPAERRCANCGWPHDAPDRFCRHCGKALGNLPAPMAAPVTRSTRPHPLGPDSSVAPT